MRLRALPLLLCLLLLPSQVRAADVVLDWIGVMNDVILAPPATNPLFTSRNVGFVGAAIFDAVNGIEKRYEPLMVAKYTGPHASSRAAAAGTRNTATSSGGRSRQSSWPAPTASSG